MALSKNPVDTSARAKLIETAQRLLGIHGLDGVSLRQISKASGSANNYAVQYHFGSAAGLIRAILDQGMPEVERLRAKRLAKVEQRNGLSDMRALMDVLYRPLIDYVDSCGERSYARFVLALYNSAQHMQHARETVGNMPVGTHVYELVQKANPGIPPALLGERLRLLTIMFLTSVFNRNPPFDGKKLDEALIDNVLSMGTRALLAPVPEGITKMLAKGSASSARTSRMS